MRLEGAQALVAGGASGLGAATARELAARGARVAVVDLDGERAASLASELGDGHVSYRADVTSEAEVEAAVEGALQELSGLRVVVSCAGIGWAERVVGREGPAKLQPFETVVRVNLIGTFNVLRYGAAAIAAGEPDEGGEGGAIGLTLPAARDLSRQLIRVCTIAPGTFDTPLLAGLPEQAREALGQQIPHPSRLGDPVEFAALACHIAENPMLNGETIRLDGALRMPPK